MLRKLNPRHRIIPIMISQRYMQKGKSLINTSLHVERSALKTKRQIGSKCGGHVEAVSALQLMQLQLKPSKTIGEGLHGVSWRIMLLCMTLQLRLRSTTSDELKPSIRRSCRPFVQISMQSSIMKLKELPDRLQLIYSMRCNCPIHLLCVQVRTKGEHMRLTFCVHVK